MTNSLNKLGHKLKSLIAIFAVAGMVSINGFAHDSRGDYRSETAEIVVDTMIMAYKANPDEARGNLGDLLSCFDFCHSHFYPGSNDHSECVDACSKQIGYLTSE